MKKKKNKSEEEKLIEQIDALSPEQKEALDALLVSEQVYDAVLSRINFKNVDEIYMEMIKNMLKRQTKDHLVFAIWNNIDDEQARHLRDVFRQTNVTAPELGYEDVLIEFALMYPELMEKVNKSLDGFFKRFVENFNKLMGEE